MSTSVKCKKRAGRHKKIGLNRDGSKCKWCDVNGMFTPPATAEPTAFDGDDDASEGE